MHPKKPLTILLTCSLLAIGCAVERKEVDRSISEDVTEPAALPAAKDEVTRSERKLEREIRARAPAKTMIHSQTAAETMAASPRPRSGTLHDLTTPAAEPVPAYPAPLGVDRENYQHLDENSIHLAQEQPVSTFSIDVDTQSYANVRRILNQGSLPRHDAVKVEELINYFDYEYPTPENPSTPFSLVTEVAPSPWSDNHILRIGLKGFDRGASELPPANLVFLIDVSGSMDSPDKLQLVQQSLRLLVNRMKAEDRIALVVYAGAEGLVLESTPGSQKAEILAKIDQLSAGGSTNGGAGIQLAYQVAQQAFIPGGINRVILASDGDFNVGMVNLKALKDLVSTKRESGIGLTTLAFGVGNTNFELMEQLADKGNGNAAYIDTLREANKVLVDEMSSTLLTIAKDVKIQVEFNPSVVQEYRLIGYENRMLRREDFKNDQVDAGEIGAGHRVTALYEITLKKRDTGLIAPLRYTQPKASADVKENAQAEIAFLKLRYKKPDSTTGADSGKSIEMSQPIQLKSVLSSLEKASPEFRFACAVAGFGQLLRGGTYLNAGFGFEEVMALANKAKGADRFGYRGEFVQLVNLASSLAPRKG